MSVLCMLYILLGPGYNYEYLPEIAQQIEKASAKYDVPAEVIASVMWLESRMKLNAVSSTGCCGLMQVQPKYSDYTCEQLQDIATGIDEGVRKLAHYRSKCGKAWLDVYHGGYGFCWTKRTCTGKNCRRRGRNVRGLIRKINRGNCD